jgi:hypothetical protein
MAASSSRGDGDTNTPPVHAAVAATQRGVALRRDALKEVHISFSQPFKQNNAALKYLRMIGENPPGKPTVDRYELTEHDPIDIGVIVHAKGTAFSFRPGEFQPWSWRYMLKSMSSRMHDELMGTGPDAGITRITCEHIPGTRDHCRINAAKQEGRPINTQVPGGTFPNWDFVVNRTDGKVVRFHTNWTKTEVWFADMPDDVAARPRLATVPDLGKGLKGPGTFKKLKNSNYSGIIRTSAHHSGGGGGGDTHHGGGGGVVDTQEDATTEEEAVSTSAPAAATQCSYPQTTRSGTTGGMPPTPPPTRAPPRSPPTSPTGGVPPRRPVPPSPKRKLSPPPPMRPAPLAQSPPQPVLALAQTPPQLFTQPFTPTLPVSRDPPRGPQNAWWPMSQGQWQQSWWNSDWHDSTGWHQPHTDWR